MVIRGCSCLQCQLQHVQYSETEKQELHNQLSSMLTSIAQTAQPVICTAHVAAACLVLIQPAKTDILTAPVPEEMASSHALSFLTLSSAFCKAKTENAELQTVRSSEGNRQRAPSTCISMMSHEISQIMLKVDIEHWLCTVQLLSGPREGLSQLRPARVQYCRFPGPSCDELT